MHLAKKHAIMGLEIDVRLYQDEGEDDGALLYT